MSNLSASSLNIHSESSSDEVQSGEDEANRLSTTNWCQCAKCSTSTLKIEIEYVCCRHGSKMLLFKNILTVGQSAFRKKNFRVFARQT